MKRIHKKNNALPTIVAWCFYDWAGSSFAVIVTTFIFATYFTTKVADNEIIGTYLWANATALSGVLIAILSPMLGAIADYGGHHKRWLLCFTLIAVVSSGLLWFVQPEHSYVHFALICVICGTVSAEIAFVFYNAYLPHLAPKDYLGRLSGWAWGCGYFGGIVALTVTLYVFIKAQPSWLDAKTAEQVRICGPFVAIWYFVFSLPLFLLAPDISSKSKSLGSAITHGSQQLLQTLKKLPQEKNILIYLIAHMIYADGLNTLFAFGGIYAAGTYGLTFEEVLQFGITMNVAAGVGAMLLSWMDDLFGSKPTVQLSLICMIIFGCPLLFFENKYHFWGAALIVALFIGPVQSASRSLMVRIIHRRNLTTEMFGLYALSGKITAFIGPWLLGTMTMLFNSQRVGMATIIIFFFIGFLLLIPVHVPLAETIEGDVLD